MWRCAPRSARRPARACRLTASRAIAAALLVAAALAIARLRGAAREPARHGVGARRQARARWPGSGDAAATVAASASCCGCTAPPAWRRCATPGARPSPRSSPGRSSTPSCWCAMAAYPSARIGRRADRPAQPRDARQRRALLAGGAAAGRARRRAGAVAAAGAGLSAAGRSPSPGGLRRAPERSAPAGRAGRASAARSGRRPAGPARRRAAAPPRPGRRWPGRTAAAHRDRDAADGDDDREQRREHRDHQHRAPGPTGQARQGWRRWRGWCGRAARPGRRQRDADPDRDHDRSPARDSVIFMRVLLPAAVPGRARSG